MKAIKKLVALLYNNYQATIGAHRFVINGTYKATISGNTGISTVKLTITGSKYGPMKSNFTMSFDKNTNKPKYIYSGTLSIGNQTFDINEIIDLI